MKTQQGATLVELLVALVIAGLIFAGVYQIYTNSIRTTTVQEQVVDMQQTARVVMDQLMRELRLAGYNPSLAGGTNGILNLLENPSKLNPTSGIPRQLQLQGDFNGDNQLDNLIYAINKDDPKHPWLTRQMNTGATTGSIVNFGANVENLIVTFYNAKNCKLGVDADCLVLDAAAAASVKRITLQLTVRTDKPDKDFKDPVMLDGYRRRSLASDVVLRNTDLSKDTTRPPCPTNVQAFITGGCRIIRVTWDRPNDTTGDLAGY
ncbi:MAG: prepilin-type N-terminal cleavage/methylation domain-containing protein, partial [Nitrospirota bacterium]